MKVDCTGIDEADLENLIDAVQETITATKLHKDDDDYIEELTELRNKLMKIRIRHNRSTYGNNG